MKLVLLSLFLLSSCSSFVQSMHKQFDNEERAKYQQYNRAQQYSNDRRPITNPRTLGVASANSSQNNYPNVRRNYSNSAQQRYQASDFKDNKSDGSLWSGKNSETFLFVNNNLKKAGDIVIIEVMNDLKDTIQDELKRNFPAPKKKTAASAQDAPAAAQEEAAPAAEGSPDKVYDKISTAVIEQVNQDYLLIRGRKEVLYKKFKRYFEIQAVVSQKDITSRDTVKSTKLLEPRINVLRY